MTLADNLGCIRGKIVAACAKAGRRTDEVTLVAVTKTFPADRMREALAAGLTDIGESKIQEAQEKFLLLKDHLAAVHKHLIGHLQTNKAKKAVEIFDVIQSVDSLRLAVEIDKHAARLGKVQDCLIEIKVSPEEAKYGLSPEDAERIVPQLQECRHVRVRGIMTMAPCFGDPQKARPYFARAKEVYDRIAAASSSDDFRVLSMGMSGDFEAAIEEGSTMVRIGTALFGER
jgi:pyridoxal phosphate enzyme (YggS family)